MSTLLVAPNGFRTYSGVYTVAPQAPPTINPNLGLVYLDNYFIAVGTLNRTTNGPYNALYTSAYSGDPYAWSDNTSYILAQVFSSGIEWIDKHHNYLVVFTANSIEFFYDAGNGLGSPLARQTIYAKNLGLMSFGYKVNVAKDRDVIYFVAKNQNNYMDVFKLENFQVTAVGSHYVREVLNYYANGAANSIYGIETINIDTHTMIMITFNGNSQGLVYFPEGDVWWTITTTDIATTGQIRSNITLAAQPGVTTQRPYYITGTQSSSIINFCTTDIEDTISNTATYYSEVIDMETHYWKHLSKVTAIGDYGNRSLTLWYSRDPTYTTFTQCNTKSPLNDGYQNAVWWDNVTRFRRGALRIDMTGIGPAKHKAFDIVYNMGNL